MSPTDAEARSLNVESAAPPLWERVAVGILALAAVVLSLALTQRGPIGDSDSVAYLIAGVNLANRGELLALDLAPLTVFPPGLSAVVAAGVEAGLSPLVTARATSALSAGLWLVLAHYMSRPLISSSRIRLGVVLSLLSAPALIKVSTSAKPEAPFVLVTLIFLLTLCMLWARRSVPNTLNLLLLAALSSTAFMFRYVGVTLIATALLVLWVMLQSQPINERFRVLATYGLLAAVVPLAWFARNYSEDGTFMGPRYPSPDSVPVTAGRIFRTLGEWLLPLDGIPEAAHITAGLLLCAATTLLTVACIRKRDSAFSMAHSLTLIVFVIVFLGYMFLSQLATAITELDSRLLSPAFIPLALLTVSTIQVWSKPRTTPVKASVHALLGVMMLCQVIGGAALVMDFDSHRIYWRSSRLESETSAKVLEIHNESMNPTVLFSNRPGVLHAATELEPVFNTPHTRTLRGIDIHPQESEFLERVFCRPSNSTALVILYDEVPAGSMGHTEIEKLVDLEKIADFDDGSVYEARSRPRTRIRCES